MVKASAQSGWRWGVILSGAALVLLAVRSLVDVQGLLTGMLHQLSRLGPWGPVLFVLLYVLATILFLPGFILTLGAGFLFGVIQGSLLVSIASTTGATLAFLIGRYLARGWVEGKIEGNRKFEAIDRAVAREGWKIVGLTRLSPIFPFNLLNYAFGLTQVRLRAYLLASWAGMIPGTVMYVYLGSLAGDLATLGTPGSARTPVQWILYLVGLLATAVLTFYVTRIARRSLEEKVG